MTKSPRSPDLPSAAVFVRLRAQGRCGRARTSPADRRLRGGRCAADEGCGPRGADLDRGHVGGRVERLDLDSVVGGRGQLGDRVGTFGQPRLDQDTGDQGPPLRSRCGWEIGSQVERLFLWLVRGLHRRGIEGRHGPDRRAGSAATPREVADLTLCAGRVRRVSETHPTAEDPAAAARAAATELAAADQGVGTTTSADRPRLGPGCRPSRISAPRSPR